MKTDLQIDNTQVIEYLKNNMLKDYSKGKVAMQLNLDWEH